MANEFRVRKKLIVNGSGSTILDVQGSQGQLFSVTDSLSGSLFSVKDISGIPVIEAFSDDTVNIGTFNAEAIKVSGSFARITGSLFGTASWANNAVTSSFAQTASYVSSTSIIGNLTQISSGSVSASVNTDISASFRITSGSNTLLNVTRDGFVWIGSGAFTNAGFALDVITGNARINGVQLGIGNGTNTTNTAFGLDAMYLGSVTGIQNTAIGRFALRNLSTGEYNTAIGADTMANLTNGSRNTSIGVQAGNVLSGVNNTVLGAFAGTAINGGNGNIFIGYTAGYALNGISNVLSINSKTLAAVDEPLGAIIYGVQSTNLVNQILRLNARTGVGLSADPVASAQFQIDSTGSGFLPTRTNLTSNISNPAQGLITYITGSSTEGLWYYLSGSIKGWTRVLNDTGSQSISGSLTVTQGITGSLFGTSSWAQNVISSSYSATASVLLGSIESASYALSASYASFAATSSYAINMIISGGLTDVDYIQFDTSTAFTNAVGRLGWDSGEGTLQLGLVGGNVTAQIGQDLFQYVYNATASPLTKGQIVYVSGSQGNRIATKLASATAEQGSANTLGFVAETISVGANGWIQTEGVLRKLNTVGLIGGGLIFLSSSAGQYTQEFPQAPLHSVRLGYAERISATVGSIYIKIDNGYELGELHNVVDNTTTSSYGDLLVKSGSLWINSKQLTGSYGLTGSLDITGSLKLSTPTYNTSSINVLTYNTSSDEVEYSTINDLTFTKNIVNVGLSGSRGVKYNVIKTAVESITDASATNTYTVRVYPGTYIEDTMTIPSYVVVKGDSSTTTVVSASNPSASIFVMSDQTMVIDMQIQGSTGPGASAIYYSSPTTPQTNAIAYAENIRFGTNSTNATCAGSGSGNCILQCSNVKYGGYTDASLKSFDIGFRVTGSGGSIGRMQLRNVTSTNGGVAGTDNNQIFALADAPGCTFIVNGCLLTRSTGTARGTGFKVYNGGSLRLTAVNFQRWINGIWAPQTGSAPSIDAIALNFENCTTDVLIQHTGSTGKVSGTDNFLKTQIALTAPLYEVGQDPRRITVGTKGADFTSISASIAYITDSSANNRYVIEVGPGQFTENTIDLTGKPYVSIVGSNIQTTQIFPSSSTQHIIKLGINNEVSFLSLANAGSGYAGLYVDDIGDFGQAHKLSFYNCDTNVFVTSRTQDTQFYGEYLDYNGTYTYGTRVSASNGFGAYANIENYYQFPSGSIATIGNLSEGQGADLNIAVATFDGTNIGVSSGTAIKLQNSASCDITSTDIYGWDYGLSAPNIGGNSRFNINGTVFRDNITYDFDIAHPTTIGRFQGTGDHTKINNASNDFYWSFMDITDGEYDITRKLSVTFDDGTHTDATTLIFKGSPMGVMEGGEITLSSGLTVTTAAGFGYCQDPLNVGIYKRIDWNNSNITLSANSNSYIYLNYNGVLSASGTAPSSIENIILGRVVTNSTGVEFIDQTPYDGAHMSNKISKFNREALGPVFAEGSIISENVTPFKLDVTQGNYYFSENNFLPSGTSSINLTQYYQSASVWARYTSSIVPNNVYASASVLAPMSASAYTKHTVYLVGEGVDEEYFLVINNNQYSSLVQTENADLPTIPTYFNDGVVPLSAIYVQSGSANITQIQDIRPIIGFRAAGVNASSVHGNLLGLSADDHTQYLRVDGFRQTTGDLGLGGNDLYNFNSLSGSSVDVQNITASIATITSITGSLLGTATDAITASYVLNAISASYAATAALAPNYVLTSATSSMTVLSASFATTSSYADNFTVKGTLTAQTIVVQTITSSTDFVTGSTRFGSLLANTHQFTGSVSITGSLGINGISVVTSNQTSSFVTNSQTGSFVTNSQTSSFVLNSQTSSMTVATASFATSSISSSFAATSSFAPLYVLTSVTASMLSPYVLSSQTSSFVTNSQTSSFVTNSQTSSMSVATASFASTASFAPSYVLNSATSSFVLNSQTSSFVTNSQTGSFATTGSNRFVGDQIITGSLILSSSAVTKLTIIGNQVVTGSLTITQGITGSLFGTSSWAENAVTSSYSFSSVSASYAATAALAPNYVLTSVTGSMLAPYVLNSNTSSFVTNSQTGSFVTNAQTSSMTVLSASFASTASYLLGGVSSTITIADEGTSQGTATFLNFTGTGVTATVSSNTASINIPGGAVAAFPYTGSAEITGSLGVTGSISVIDGGFTGSLFGTASWANNAITASYVLNAISASYAATAALAPNYVLTSVTSSMLSPYLLSTQTSSFVTNSQTSSFVTNSQTSSFVTNAQTSSMTVLSASFATTSSFAHDFTVKGTLTAQTIVVQTITSSTDYITGSTRFGSLLTNTHQFTGSVSITGSLTTIGRATIQDLTGSLFGTASYVTGSIFTSANPALSASYALTASYALNGGGGAGLTMKSNAVANSSFTGNPKKATVTFATAFPNTNYAVVITGEDARSWTIESKVAGSFVINANSNTALAGTTYWHAIAYGEA